jgi:hypothetical protein
MNKRIKELALHSANEIADLFNPGFFNDRMVNDVAEINKKFAQLIVEKCIASLQVPKADLKYLNEYNQGWVRGRLLAIENIKKDFEIL